MAKGNALIENNSLEYIKFKQKTMEEREICSAHFRDEAIIDFIESNGSQGSCCSFCKPKYQSEFTISFGELIRFLQEGITYFYGDAADNGLAYDSEEGGYQDSWFCTSDLINYEICLDIDKQTITDAIIAELPDYSWCKNDPFTLNENYELMSAWEYFVDIIKHKTRYSFFRTKQFNLNGGFEVSDVLRRISLCIDNLNLIKKLDKGSEIFRCRQHSDSENIANFSKLTSPPQKACIYPNRMSPAGISMFYGAFDEATAILEVIDNNSKNDKPKMTIGKFILLKDLYIIDLSNLPNMKTPSIFDNKTREDRFVILFLKEFVDEISKEIIRKGEEHIEYVPTQVLTEYFRFVLPEIANIVIDGIIYPSAKNKDNKCCVLFFDNEESKEILELPIDNISQTIIT